MVKVTQNFLQCRKSWLWACVLSVSGAQLQSSVERPCPGERVTFTCTLSSIRHYWSVPSLGITRTLLPNDQGQGTSDPPFQFSVTKLRTCTSITSTATVTTTSDLNGTLVLCQDGIGMLPDQNSTITLRGMGIMYLYLDKQAVDNWYLHIVPVIYLQCQDF